MIKINAKVESIMKEAITRRGIMASKVACQSGVPKYGTEAIYRLQCDISRLAGAFGCQGDALVPICC